MRMCDLPDHNCRVSLFHNFSSSLERSLPGLRSSALHNLCLFVDYDVPVHLNSSQTIQKANVGIAVDAHLLHCVLVNG